MAVTMFGHPIFINMDFYDFLSPFISALLSIEKIYQALYSRQLLDHICEHLRVKNTPLRVVFSVCV